MRVAPSDTTTTLHKYHSLEKKLFFAGIIGFHAYFFSFTAISLIMLTHGINSLIARRLKIAIAKDKIREKTAQDIMDLTNVLNPAICENTKHFLNIYFQSCSVAVVMALTFAEMHIQLANPLGEFSKKQNPQYLPPLTAATLRKCLNFGTRALLGAYLTQWIGNSYLCFAAAQFVGNCVNEILKFKSTITEGESKKEHGILLTSGIKSGLCCLAKYALSAQLEHFKECKLPLSTTLLTTVSSVGLFIFHDLIRDGAYLLIKYKFMNGKTTAPKATYTNGINSYSNGHHASNGHHTNGHSK